MGTSRSLTPVFEDAASLDTVLADWEERFGRAYLYWTPRDGFAISVEYSYERFSHRDHVGREEINLLKTHRFPLGFSYFHPCGFIARLNPTYVDQEGVFGDPFFGPPLKDDDKFWVVDATIGYRLPNRWGLVSIEAKNLLDEEFKFQDTDPANPTIYPERLILGKITLAF